MSPADIGYETGHAVVAGSGTVAYDGSGWWGGEEPLYEGPSPARRARVSVWASLGLVLGLVGLCATLTGLLAPEGFALGAAGLLACVVGIAAARRPHVAGRGLGVLGALFALAAMALAGLAVTGRLPWLSSRTDQVSAWHTWLLARWPWLRRW